MSCNNLCTAAKCQELEERIGALEQALELLQASFEAHTSQDIPQAHNYNPPPLLPTEQHVKSNLKLDGSFQGDVLTLTVADGESQDTATISIPLPEIPEIPESEQHVKSNLKLDGSFQGDVLTLTVADGESQDTATITIFFPELPDMNCDNLQQEFRDCCDQLSNLISNSFNNLDNQLNNLENAINSEIKFVYDEITVDISGTTKSDYSCKFPLDDDSNYIPGYALASSEEKTYTGKGLQGIHENLKIINENLTSIYDDVCKAIEPIQKITIDDLYQYCDDSGIERTNFPEGFSGDQEYANAVEQYFQTIFNETKYAYLLENAPAGALIVAPNNWINTILTDFSLIQSKINNKKLCSLSKKEETDVVSIVACDQVIAYAKGKILILHFVQLDNYPKRARGSIYWQVQIPAAKDSYVWEDDFLDLRFTRGNQYAELHFNEFKTRVSGFFASEAAANEYFDKVLDLTTATEKNRVFSKHKTPQTSVVEQITRPYRAFVEQINSEGRAECLIKYVPSIEQNE